MSGLAALAEVDFITGFVACAVVVGVCLLTTPVVEFVLGRFAAGTLLSILPVDFRFTPVVLVVAAFVVAVVVVAVVVVVGLGCEMGIVILVGTNCGGGVVFLSFRCLAASVSV